MMMRGLGQYVETVPVESGWGPVDPDAPATEALPTGGVPELALSQKVWDPEIGAFVLVAPSFTGATPTGDMAWSPIRTVVPLLKPFQVSVFPPETTFMGMNANTALMLGFGLLGAGLLVKVMR